MTCVAVALAATAPSAGSGSDSATIRLRPTSSVSVPKTTDEVVADGNRAAALDYCAIRLWRPGFTKTALVKPCIPPASIEGSTSLDAVALAGDRLVWIRDETESHGEYVDSQLVVKTGSRKPYEVVSSSADVFANSGDQLVSLAGSGNTVAFGWTYNNGDFINPVQKERIFLLVRASDPRAAPCPSFGSSADRLCVDAGVDDSVVDSAAAGRVLLSFGDGAVEVVEPDGSARILHIPYAASKDDLALLGSELVVIRASGNAAVYDASTGAQLQTWPIVRATGLRRLTVGGGYALFRMHGFQLLKLSTGRELTLVAPTGKPPTDASVTSTGVFFLYRVGRRLRLGFVPFARL